MKKLRQSSKAKAFTLLEVIIVLAITAPVLGAEYSLAQSTLMLADDVRRAERRDARMQAFTTFCEHLLAELPSVAYGMAVIDFHGFSQVKSYKSCTSLFTRQQCAVPHRGGPWAPSMYGNFVQTA